MVSEIWSATARIFLSSWAIFCLFTPIKARKIKISKKIKKHLDIYIILHDSTKNHDHMLYCFWDMACDRCSCYYSFWAIFCPFTHLTAWTIKIFKKFLKSLEISSFYTIVPEIMIICYTVPEIWRMTDVVFIIHFGLFFALLPT